MKIKTSQLSYDELLALPKEPHHKPRRPLWLIRMALKIASQVSLLPVGFSCNKIGMEKLGKNEPCLILMNHSSFIDLRIAFALLFRQRFNIVCTSDGFVGKAWLMRLLGCIPTQKFITDSKLVRDMLYAVKKLGNSILMYPEASYSFDGTATPLPQHFGKCVKMLGIPVVMVQTYGAFARDPLYNGLRLRKVKISADMRYILSPAEIETKSAEEIQAVLEQCFSFDNFRWQQENKVKVDESFRAEGLNRVLYKCPHCLTEGEMLGKDTYISCSSCGSTYELNEYGALEPCDSGGRFTHIPDWYAWQRECVRRELLNGQYSLDTDVDIYAMVDSRSIYKIGEGRLHHDKAGFVLDGCDGKLHYEQKPQASYSLYADYYWYEIGDMICIGNNNILYYCFPKNAGDIVAKTRLATEELYKITQTAKESKKSKEA